MSPAGVTMEMNVNNENFFRHFASCHELGWKVLFSQNYPRNKFEDELIKFLWKFILLVIVFIKIYMFYEF